MPEGDVRLGVLTFLNAYPVYAGLSLLASPADRCRFVPGEAVADPVALNQGLASGELDLAPASAAAVAGRPERFLTAPGISISSEGAVGSVVLFSRVPLRELTGYPIALPANSATSVALLRILCRNHWRIRPDFVTFAGPPQLDLMLARCDAALLIGDAALRARLEGEGLLQVDLGQAWHEFCGLPAVFALWAFRREWAAARPEAFRWACRRLLEARAAGLDALPRAIPGLAAARRLPASVVREYFELLDYRFEETHRRSLELFLSLSRSLGAGPPAVAGPAVGQALASPERWGAAGGGR